MGIFHQRVKRIKLAGLGSINTKPTEFTFKLCVCVCVCVRESERECECERERERESQSMHCMGSNWNT